MQAPLHSLCLFYAVVENEFKQLMTSLYTCAQLDFISNMIHDQIWENLLVSKIYI